MAIIEGWPYLKGFVLSNILNGDAIGTKVSTTRYREGGCSSGVAIKRGSTVAGSPSFAVNQTFWCVSDQVLSVTVKFSHLKEPCYMVCISPQKEVYL